MRWTDWWDLGTMLAIFLVFIGAIIVGGREGGLQ